MRSQYAEDFQCPFCGVKIDNATQGLVAKHFISVHGVITKERNNLRSLLIKLQVVDLPIGQIVGEWEMLSFVFGKTKVVRKSKEFILFQQGKKCKVKGSLLPQSKMN